MYSWGYVQVCYTDSNSVHSGTVDSDRRLLSPFNRGSLVVGLLKVNKEKLLEIEDTSNPLVNRTDPDQGKNGVYLYSKVFIPSIPIYL